MRRLGKRVYRRRKMLRKKARKGRTVLVNRALAPFAQRFITKMKYAETLTQVGPALGGLTQFTFNLNSIQDPNRTGIGHQPYGHDTMSSLYNRYRVIKCNYVISGVVTGSSGDQYGIIAALPANEVAAVSGGVPEVQENPRCKFVTQAPNSGSKVLKGSVYIPSLVGRTKAQYMADDRYQATYGTSPNELAILNIFTGLTSGVNEQVTAKLNVVLEYVVESFDVKQLAQS